MTKKTKDNVIEFNTPYGKKAPRCFFHTEGVSMTQQQFAEESEINNIIARYDRTGVLDHVNKGSQIYADFSKISDLTEALEQIKLAQEEFQGIPSSIREKFQNDAGQFFKFASNPDNIEQMREYGLAPATRPTESTAMQVDNPISETEEPQNSEVQK
jgi:phage internal scaffolding protein